MCGIVGCVGKIFSSEERAFKDMLKFDTVRGEDSTGVLSVLHTKGTKIFKDIGTAYDLMKWKEFDDTVDRRSSALLLGHNRAATRGKVKPENAHPFDYDPFIGVHNGTLTAQWRLEDHKQFEVDSENIYYHMSLHGVNETLKVLDGAFALAFYDKDNHQLNLVRNRQRPLCYAFTEDKKTMFFASEGWMIAIACSRHGIKIGEIFDLTPQKIYRFDVPDVYGGTFAGYDDARGWSKEDATFFTPVETSHCHGGSSRWPRTQETSGHTNKEEPKSNVIPFDPKNKKEATAVMQKYMGKTVDFSVDWYVGGTKKQPSFFRCSEEVEDLMIKIFVDKKNPLFKLMSNSSKGFQGKIKGFGQHDGKWYFTLDHRSIVEVDYEPMYYGFENKRLNMIEWRNKTEKGCAVCESIPLSNDSAILEWFDDDHFLCFNCQGTHTGASLVSARNAYNSHKES